MFNLPLPASRYSIFNAQYTTGNPSILIDQKPELSQSEMTGFFQNLMWIGSDIVAIDQFIGLAECFGGIGDCEDAIEIRDFFFNRLLAHEFIFGKQ